MNEAQTLIERLRSFGLSDGAIADIIYSWPETISRIRRGEYSGRNVLPRLRELVSLVDENRREQGKTLSRN